MKERNQEVKNTKASGESLIIVGMRKAFNKTRIESLIKFLSNIMKEILFINEIREVLKHSLYQNG